MKPLKVHLAVAVGIVLSVGFGPGCSGKGAVSVTLSPASQSINPGQTVTITATVANDTNNQGVSWTLSGPGSLNSSTTTSVIYAAPTVVSTSTTATVTATSIANSSATAIFTASVAAVLQISTTSLPAATVGSPYNAFINATGATAPFTWGITSGSLPAGLSLSSSTTSSIVVSGTPTAVGTTKFTIQVTDSAGTTVSQALSITVNPPPPLSISTTTLPAGTVGVPYSAGLQAASGTRPYTWSITSGNLPVGLTMTNAGVIAGTPVASGTTSFTVQVVDSSSPQQTATANLSITINPQTSNNARLNGNYAFLVSGFDSSVSPAVLFVASGSFVADGNGNITGGVIDTNDAAGPQTNVAFTGTYSIGSNNFGTFCVIVSGSSCSRTFALAMSADGNARIIEFDDTTGTGTRNSGVLLKQNTAAFAISAINNSYAFGFLGADSLGKRLGLAGQFSANGNGGINSGGELDSNDAGTVASSVAITGGSYTAPSASNGRGSLSLATSTQTTTYSFYVVSATQLLVIEVDSVAAGNPLVSGLVLQQASGLGTSSLTGYSVFETTATCSATSPSQGVAGLFFGDGNGNFTITADQNCGGTLSSLSSSGTYSVVSGRVTVGTTIVLYLVQSNQAFMIGTDSGVTSGFLQAQSAQPFSNASLSGTYAGGSISPVDPNVNNEVGTVVVGSSALTITTNISSSSGLMQNQTTQNTYSVGSNGRVVLPASGNPSEILYLISPSQYIGLATDATARIDEFQQ